MVKKVAKGGKAILRKKEHKEKNTKKIKEDNETIVVKRGRGRPRKNPINLINPNNPNNVTKKIGRPKKTLSYNKEKEDYIPLFPLKNGKHVGCCPFCHTALSTLDSIKTIVLKNGTQDIYLCYRCDKEIKQKHLLEDNPKKQKYKSKKEYLEDCLKINDDSYIPIHTVEVVSENLIPYSPSTDILSEE